MDSSDDAVVSATANTDAMTGQYSIDVQQLAQSHKVASEVLDQDTRFGPGQLQISAGEKTFSVDVPSYARLTDVVRGINGAKDNPGVRASVINDMNGPRLILASNQSGQSHQLKVSADGQPDSPLKKLEFKTLEDRVKDLEKARAAAQEIIAPLTRQEQ